MKLVFTDEAKADLLHNGEWIAEDNPGCCNVARSTPLPSCASSR
jgi:hypothetical protein